MNAGRRLLLAMMMIGCAQALAQQRREPSIGYVYPAGGKQHSSFRVTIGGQNLRGASEVYITGTGVHASVLQHYPPVRNVNSEQREALGRKMRELFEQRWAEMEAAGLVGPAPRALRGLDRARRGGEDEPTTAPVELPPSPLLYDLEHKSLRELLHVRQMLAAMRMGQPNAQIAESVLIEVSIDRDAPQGERELRLGGQLGLTNPLLFEIGALPEVVELEEDDSRLADLLPAEPPLEVPMVVNGQIMPGDVDRFRFRAEQGQGLVVQVHARRLIPFLADAVPGWFQATVSIYDAAGNEIAFADDYRFDPDPVLYFQVPADGEYTLEIRDSIYRGRQDFVYRVTVGELPFITALFPLGTRTEHKRYVSIEGWNLHTDRLLLDPQHDLEGIFRRSLGYGKSLSNCVTYAVNDMATEAETEPNDAPSEAQRVILPHIIDGRIAAPGDVDVYQFKGKAGGELVAEVIARRLNSPLDSLLQLLDADGNRLAWNDDHESKDGFLHLDMGVLTHSADSYLRYTLPKDGVYFVQIADAQAHGGAAYGYRLRIGPPRPDFALRATPSSITVGGGGTVPLRVFALRKDGFDGEIEIILEDPVDGFRLVGATIPAGRDQVRLTLTAPRRRFDQPVALRLAGRAQIAGGTVSRPVKPADDQMQAFLYRHLTPAQEMLVAVRGNRPSGGEIAISGDSPVRIRAGKTAEIRIDMPPRLLDGGLEFELNGPPPGITLEETRKRPGGVVLVIKADAQAASSGVADNLIVEGFMNVTRPRRGGGGSRQTVRTSVGFLPAIPIVVVSQ